MQEASKMAGRPFQVATFGGLLFTGRANQAVNLCTDNSRNLFLYLLVNRGHMVHRESICAALWPDLDERRSRALLSKSLWRIRHSIENSPGQQGDEVIVQSDHLVGLAETKLDVDFWRLADALVAIEFTQDEAILVEQAKELSSAVRLCQGNFCIGLFDEWCEAQRLANEQLRLDAIDRLIRYHQSQNNWSQAASWARQAIELDPLREDMHYAIMDSYCSMGNRLSAIKQYKQYERILARELDVAPSERIQNLFSNIAQGVGV